MTQAKTDLARLTTKLQAPLYINDVLNTAETFDGDAQYALHDTISDMQPDAALLTIALSLQNMIENVKNDPANTLRVAHIACAHIINTYGTLWLAHTDNETIDNSYVIQLLKHIPEDCEDLVHFIELTAAFCDEDSTASAILDVLRIQASAHSLVAEEFISVMEHHIPQTIGASYGAAFPVQEFSNNVIEFPLTRQ